MIEPDWREAPPDATHWDNLRGNWCNEHGFYHKGKFWECNFLNWGTERFMPRPEKEQTMNDYMTPEEEKIPAENWIEDAPTLSDQAERMYHQTSQVDTKNYAVPNSTSSAMSHQEGGNHYKDMAIQPVEFIHHNKLGFCAGNVIKYVCRYQQKNGIEDLKKARHYIDLLIEMQAGQE